MPRQIYFRHNIHALSCLYANTLNDGISIYTLQRLFCGLIHCIVNAYFFLTNNSAGGLLPFFFIRCINLKIFSSLCD